MRPAIIACIGSLSMEYASAELVHMVSPPKGGISTERSIVMAGGSGRNGESVCQPEPKMCSESVVGFLDERLHLAESRHAVGIGILREVTEAAAEGMMFRVADLLAAEIDHLVAEQCVLDLGELRIGFTADAHSQDLGAHGSGQRPDLDVSVRARAVVELASWMQEHGYPRGLMNCCRPGRC